eukprot:TRINITY_DN3360_c0_g1_i4.p2 TRINITY_DN3360_c0_g1~~TRINITY_DN3360_c0_g1_i4.p2  ORF type:complete len:287 (-),score=49.66 TRINITY_DN3360_c0_g1_i4:78-938(-)
MSGGGGGYPSNYDNSQYGYGYGSQPGNNDSNYSPYQNQYPQHNPYPQGGPQQQHQQQQQQQQQQQFQPGFKMDPLNIDPLQAAKAISQAGNYWQGGQQFFQQRMGWLQGASYYFNVDLPYVRNKLFMLLTPYLPKWTYVRLPEQISGGNKYRPPRADDNAPDLYIPFMALFTYCVMAAGHQLIEGKFKPDIMYPLAWYACMGWVVHFLVLRVILWMFHLPQGVPTLEIVALSGYPFVMISLTVVAFWVGGKFAWWGVGVYGAACIGLFLIRSVKQMHYFSNTYSDL